MTSSKRSSNAFFAAGGPPPAPPWRPENPYLALDELMVVVEALCPEWPARRVSRDGDLYRLQPNLKKSQSSKQWLRRHVNDPYVQRSKREGYRSRSAYKLIEIDEKDRFLKAGQTIVDLGAAPGGWSQVLAKRLGGSGTIIAIDLLPMDPISGVTFIQGDFSSKRGLDALRSAVGERQVDVVLSDMAPNLSGIAVSDQARSMTLAELAFEFAQLHLKRDGTLLVKIFQGAGYDDYLKCLRRAFLKVAIRKPDASRDESAEQYLLARGLKTEISAREG